MRPTRLQSAVRRALRATAALRPGDVLVAGLSGGADSVALLGALRSEATRGGFRVVAAHLDHGLREGSAEDAAFCAGLCAGLGVPLRTARRDVRARAAADKRGIEDAARVERQAFLREVMASEGAVAIALAHTRDDQAETVLLRLLRGSGTVGLGAMRARAGAVIRPLLEVGRAEVMAHLQAHGLSWREDPTNQDLSILRNRVRHELVPYLESRFNPGVRRALGRAAALLADDADALAALAGEGGLRVAGDAAVLPRAALTGVPRALARTRVRQALKAAGGLRGVTGLHVERLVALSGRAGASGRRVALPGRREAVIHFDEIHIGPGAEAAAPFVLDLAVPGEVVLPGGVRLVARAAAAGDRMAAAETLVAAPFAPLQVRTRRPGDRVLGRRGDTSLRRFLVERRVPAAERDRVAVVAAGRRVVWIAGQPALPAAPDDRYVRLALESARQGATA